MKYFVANWKANKNLKEAKEWLNEFLKLYQPQENKMVIICPPFPLLTELRDKIYKVKNLKLGSQDLSFFEEGPYTGEVTAKTLQGIVDYALIGHSERRKYFKESSEIISKKIVFAKKYQIEPILCLSQEMIGKITTW
jgi:triosephosphate isomerase